MLSPEERRQRQARSLARQVPVGSPPCRHPRRKHHEKAAGGEENRPWGQGQLGSNPGLSKDQLCTLGWLNLCVSRFLHVPSWVNMALTPWASVRAQCCRLFAASGDLESMPSLRKTAEGRARRGSAHPIPGRPLRRQASPPTSCLGGTGGGTVVGCIAPRAQAAGAPSLLVQVQTSGKGSVALCRGYGLVAHRRVKGFFGSQKGQGHRSRQARGCGRPSGSLSGS